MEKYWFRKSDHTTLLGPWTLDELRQALAKDQVSLRWDSRQAMDGANAEVLPATGWNPVWQLLGLPEPEAEKPRADPSATLNELREQTHYRLARSLTKLLMLPTFLAAIAMLIFGVLGLCLRDYANGFGLILGAVFYAISMGLGFLIVNMLIDIADCLVVKRKQ